MFRRARIRLTVLYIGLFALVLGVFSLVFYIGFATVLAPAFDIGPELTSEQVAEVAYQTTLERIGFALLELLARHPGQVFTRDRLIDALWDADFAAESNIVEVYIRSLRRTVDEGRRDGLIETVRGSGYRLRASGAA